MTLGQTRQVFRHCPEIYNTSGSLNGIDGYTKEFRRRKIDWTLISAMLFQKFTLLPMPLFCIPFSRNLPS